MVAAEADWLYNLEEWNDIFDEETRKELYKEQKSSTTIVKEQKVYPNDPCPCGSGKKYKKCCGRSKLNTKGVFRRFAESPFFVFPEFNIVLQERKGYI